MSKKSLLIVTMLMTMGAGGRSLAQSQALTMSLEQLFQTADQHNTSIKSFDAAIREAEAGIKAAKAERQPDVDASVAFSYLGGGRITDRDFSNGFGCILAYALMMYFTIDVNAPLEGWRLAIALRGCAYAILAATLMWSLDESIPDLEHFFMGLFVFNIFHMYLAGAAGYGVYTTLFSHFLNDDIARYGSLLTLTHLDLSSFNMGRFMDQYFLHSMMSVALKQIYGLVIWFSGSMMLLFLLLDIPAVRTNVRKVPYWPVFGIEMLSRIRPLYMKRKKEKLLTM